MSRTTKDRQIIIERTFDTSPEDVWSLWTTKDGIEAWWGPQGFVVTVQYLDFRVGGELRYTMTATRAQEIAFMQKAGMPLSTPAKITYTEIVPLQRLAYLNLADFIPGVAPYDVATVVELHPTAQGVRLVLILDQMHDTSWTERMAAGWESELEKLAALIAGRT